MDDLARAEVAYQDPGFAHVVEEAVEPSGTVAAVSSETDNSTSSESDVLAGSQHNSDDLAQVLNQTLDAAAPLSVEPPAEQSVPATGVIAHSMPAMEDESSDGMPAVSSDEGADSLAGITNPEAQTNPLMPLP